MSGGTTKTTRITGDGHRSHSESADQHGHRRWRRGVPGDLPHVAALILLTYSLYYMHDAYEIRKKSSAGSWMDCSPFYLESTSVLPCIPTAKCAQTTFSPVDSTATWLFFVSNCDLSNLLSLFRPKYFSSHLHFLDSDTTSSNYPYYD